MKYCTKQRNKEKEKASIEADNKKAVDDLWTFVDRLSADDIVLLEEFIKTDNAPIERPANTFYSYDSLLGSEAVHYRVVQEPQREEIHVNRNKLPNAIIMPAFIYTDGKKQYILKDDFYQILKYSHNKYGRISHFK